MKKIIFTSMCMLFVAQLALGQGITTARYADITAINGIASPPEGMMVYNIATQSYWYKSSSGWVNQNTAVGGSFWTAIGNNIVNNNSGTVGIANLASSPATGTSKLVAADDAGVLRIMPANVGNSASPFVLIPDNTCLGVADNLTISGAPTSFQSNLITVSLNITHPNDADLVIYLRTPTGQVLNLAYREGSGASFSATTFNDGFPSFLNSSVPPFTGGFKPTGNMLNGPPIGAGVCVGASSVTPTGSTFGALGSSGIINPNGTWTLIVKDLAGGNIGSLLSWSINFADGKNQITAPLQIDNSVQNKKLVLFDGSYDQNQFYGFGINPSVLRYQVAATTNDHVFYAGTSATTSDELVRMKGTGAMEVNGSIKTKYSGSVIVTPPGTGNQLFNLTIPALPAGWDLTNTVVLVSIADGGYGQIGQVKLLNATTIEIRETVQVGGATRYNYIVFKL